MSRSTKQVLHQLNDRCESALKILGDLVRIHKRMDAAVDWQMDGDPAYRPRLHKAFVHIAAIARWHMDGEVFHVMVPEIRAAAKALDPLVQESLPLQLSKGSRNRHSFLIHEEDLVPFAHPTLYSLSDSRGRGGFGNTGYVRYLRVAYVALSQLAATYAYAIGNAAERFAPASVDELNTLITEEALATQTLDWEAIARSVDD